MPDEALIAQIEIILEEIITLGGQNERTEILPNLTVTNANPSGLTGFVIVSDGRDGDNILAKKVPSVVYTNNDTVNVLFQKGGEAVAFQQGSQSNSGDLWEIVPSTTTDIYYDRGKVGIGTATIPHNGVGWAALAIEGGDYDSTGANIQLTTTTDDYPTMQIFGGGTHDEVAIFFDSYYDGANRSSTTDQNFQILATGATLRFRYDSGVAAGAVLTWNEGLALKDNGRVGIANISPSAKLEVVDSSIAQLRLSHTALTKFADFTVDTNHDLTIKPSSTGQVILQPTANSANFFQVLDAAAAVVLQTNTTSKLFGIGKVPVQALSVSGTAEISGNLGIGITGPSRNIHVQGSNATGIGLTIELDNTSVAVNSFSALTFKGNNGVVNVSFFADGLGSAVGTPAGVFRTFSSHPLIFGTNATEAMRIDTSQNVVIGNTTASAQLHVDQASTTAAIPVLYLDQADISEEMIEFNTTIGVGNAIEAVGAKTMTPTHFVKVTLPGGLTRYFEVGTIA